MATPKPFQYAGFLSHLEQIAAFVPLTADTPMPPVLARMLLAADGTGQPAPAVAHLIQLFKARKAVLQASSETALVADELRRYQKFAKPGQPSPHIVQLRQQQAAVRQASSRSKQSFIKAAAAFVREAGIDVPQRMALEVFIVGWSDANVPLDAVIVS
ncbi:hypothetical protein [Rhodanobacter terrae]|uniref:Uncharacterized protein n=1 Tax=Rhodanobacter terrae TaxID=418647 RepID=A0ABW0SXV7_9GAMM